jgi:hypothetical protein
MSQKDKVLKILKEKGEIDNYYCVETKLTLRLGAIINVLKEEGYEFDEEKSGYIPNTKNWRYVFKSKPKVEYKVVGRPELTIKSY